MTTPKTKLAGLALIVALCGGFFLGLTAPAWAGLDQAVAAYQRGDYATAIRELRLLCEQGNALKDAVNGQSRSSIPLKALRPASGAVAGLGAATA